MDLVMPGNKVLVIWGKGGLNGDNNVFMENLKQRVAPKGLVLFENIDRLSFAMQLSSTFDLVLSIVALLPLISHSLELCENIMHLLKPDGKFVLNEVVRSENHHSLLKAPTELLSMLKFTGFANISEPKYVTLPGGNYEQNIRDHLKLDGDISIVEIISQKPNFEVGSSAKISFIGVPQIMSHSKESKAVWKLDIDDTELIDPDILLDEEDLKKPDLASLKVCGTTGKRKACKNCSCGLQEELKTTSRKDPTSACGNCYLGDAFRCTSCPYIGMPAFKPGEKILLTDNQLKGDV